MKKGKYAKRRSIKPVAVLTALVLLVGCAIGGTVAWLTDKTTPVTNTFTAGKVGVTLTETTTDYKMIPGHTISKNPIASVTAESEDCYLFVKVTKSSNFDDYLEYAVADGWTKLDSKSTGNDAVYYMIFNGADGAPVKGRGYSVLSGDKVTVKTGVTQELMDLIDGIDSDGKTDTTAAKAEIDARPTLIFTAYAIQYKSSNNSTFSPEQAWEKVMTSASNA